MKYIFKFEDINKLKIGDIVVCKRDPNFHDPINMQKNLRKGQKYKILKIYKYNEYTYVDIENITTGIITKGWGPGLFKTEIEFDADKYNL